MIDRLNIRALLFCTVAAGVSATAVVLAGMLSGLERPGAVAIGITLDLTLMIPIAYYFLVVRPRGWPIISVAPVFIISLLIAATIIPAEHQQMLGLMEALAIPIELTLLGWIG